MSVAIGAAQQARLEQAVAVERGWGLSEDDLTLLGAGQLAERVHVAGACGGSYSPHAARVHPAKLVRGLAAVVRRAGVAIHERTPVGEIGPGYALTAGGRVGRSGWSARPRATRRRCAACAGRWCRSTARS